jgi:hypothetical protein
MKRCIVAFVLMSLVPASLAQTPGRVQTTTRLVILFSNLENQLISAMSSGHQERAAALLTDDFSEWTPLPPGSPIARDEWLKRSRPELQNALVRQMAVKDIGDHAVADFVLLAGDQAWFTVDVWQKQGADWKLQQRYQALVDAAPFRAPVHPTGKN